MVQLQAMKALVNNLPKFTNNVEKILDVATKVQWEGLKFLARKVQELEAKGKRKTLEVEASGKDKGLVVDAWDKGKTIAVEAMGEDDD
jgi:hypothetical protein